MRTKWIFCSVVLVVSCSSADSGLGPDGSVPFASETTQHTTIEESTASADDVSSGRSAASTTVPAPMTVAAEKTDAQSSQRLETFLAMSPADDTCAVFDAYFDLHFSQPNEFEQGAPTIFEPQQGRVDQLIYSLSEGAFGQRWSETVGLAYLAEGDAGAAAVLTPQLWAELATLSTEQCGYSILDLLAQPASCTFSSGGPTVCSRPEDPRPN